MEYGCSKHSHEHFEQLHWCWFELSTALVQEVILLLHERDVPVIGASVTSYSTDMILSKILEK